ncbi:MAG: LuxR family transcriptional regulator [Ilumatobacteraceae bacterium]
MTTLYGREIEQRFLLDQLNEARSDACSLVVEGDAGIGKSALLDWLGRQAQGFQVLRSRGHEADSDMGYLVVRQLIGPILASLDHLDAHLAAALRAAISLTNAPVDEALVSLALLELFSAASELAPLLVVVDDAHLVDRPSMSALAFVARRAVSERQLLVFATRPHEFPDPAQLAPLRRLELSGLDAAASRGLLAASGRPPSPELVRQCRGNPLALLYLPDNAVPAAGDLPVDAERLPVRLRERFATMIARYPGRTRRALGLLAAAGTLAAGTRDLALAAIGASAGDLELPLREGVLVGDGEFAHPLLRAAAMADGDEALSLHDALAEAFTPGPRDRHLFHALRGSGPHTETVIDEAQAHARLLFDHGRFDDSAALLVAASARATDRQRRTTLWYEAGRAMARAGRYLEALRYFERAGTEAPSIESRLSVSRIQAWIELWAGLAVAPGIARLRADLAAAPSENIDPVELARAWASLVGLYIVSDLRIANVVAAEVPAGVAPFAEPLIAKCMANTPDALQARRLLDENLVAARQLVSFYEVEERTGDLLMLEGRWEECDAWAQQLLASMRAAHHVAGAGTATAYAVTCRVMLGDVATAYGLALAALERSADDNELLNRCAFVGAVVGAEPAREWALEARRTARESGFTVVEIEAEHRLGLLHLAADQPDAAVVHMDACWRLMTDRGFDHPGTALARGDIAETFARVGRAKDAWALIGELEAGPFDLPWARGVAARARGILGELDAFPKAVDLLARSPWELARTRLVWARSLPVTDAAQRRLAADALRSFDEMGARPWSAQARNLLAEPGGEAAREHADLLAPLSARERTVAFSVARGLSNREIASELFISQKTVDAHLQQVYRKLNLRSRTQLSALCHAGTFEQR